MRIAVAYLIVAACYAPHDQAGTPCTTACPGELACIGQVCREPGYALDARPPDAQPIDAAPGDMDGDGVTDPSDNCVIVANSDQHDEDSDGIGDRCDPCPHLAGTTADTDGDGVGDACDPQPTVPKQRILFFDPFTKTTTAWSLGAESSISGDQLHVGTGGATNSVASLTIGTGELRIVAGGTISNVSATNPHQLTIAFGHDPQGLYHYVEIYDQPAGGHVGITRYAGGTLYSSLASTPYTPPMKTGAWAMQVDESVTTHTIALTGMHGGASFGQLSAPAPQLVVGPRLTIHVHDSSLTVDYLVAIETMP